MLTILKKYIKDKYNKQGNVFLGLVHRLDRPVGGVMVFARTSKGASRLSDQIRKGEFRKTYLAVVRGIPKDHEGRLEHYLLKDSKTNTVRVVSKNNEGAKKAVLEYKILQSEQGLSLVKVNLLTGRPHQIRVQFSTMGMPLFGDQKYGSSLNKPGQQLALWSVNLKFKHPTLKEEVDFFCNPPELYPWNIFKK
jgi:23S rRNA pseudouridine1911/1915/1917 synthase